MMKFLLIIGGIFLLGLMILNSLKNKILRMFGNFNEQAAQQSGNPFGRAPFGKKEDVLYEKDETVILKGEAKNDSKKYDY